VDAIKTFPKITEEQQEKIVRIAPLRVWNQELPIRKKGW